MITIQSWNAHCFENNLTLWPNLHLLYTHEFFNILCFFCLFIRQSDTDGQDVEAYYQEDQEKENGISHAYDEPRPAYIVVEHVDPGEKKAYFAWSIFSIFCCCVLVGIPALTFSIRTNAANDRSEFMSEISSY